MGQYSTIEWTTHTFNPWWGCVRVSPGCEHCYAETLAKRWGHAVWGPAKTTSRRMMSDAYWQQPIKWNEAAERSGERARVFCASMADVFEEHPDLEAPRWRLWDLIEATPWLDWLLLTKRPENVLANTARWAPYSANGKWPDNIWMGASAEDQRRLDERIEHLQRIPAKVRFLSCEPLLSRIALPSDAGVHWVIVGGESGAHARPMNPDWARDLRDQCQTAGVAFFFKQWGGIHKAVAGRLLDGREWNEVPQ